MSDQTMAASFASAFLDYAVAEGALRRGLLAASRLTDKDLADQDTRIPVASYQALIGAGIEGTGDTSLLLRHVLHHLLTAGTGQVSRYDYSPRHLWGDFGRPEGRPPLPRRPLPKRLLRWRGAAR